MNIHTATEVAYKNGYAAGAEECASRLKSLAKSNTTLNETDIDSILEEILQNKSVEK